MPINPLTAALDAVNAEVAAAPTDSNLLIATKCRALLRGYAARWNDSQYQPIEVEAVITTDLVNPETQAKSRTFKAAGKLDVVAVFNGRRVLIDHKTTSDDITDPAGAFWRILVVEAQPSHYMLLKWIAGEKLDEACWDVLRKPSISPKQFKSKAEKASIISTRRYFDQLVDDATLTYLQTADRENLSLYEARLFHDCTVERPQVYYQRRTIPRLDAELLEYSRELWEAGQLIVEARRLNRWPKHPGACMSYGRACPFLGICSGFDRPDSDKWQLVANVHPELPELPGDGRSVLTFSSIRTFQICPRRFYYRHEMGIERVDEEDAESLRFGRLWHIGLEHYWKSLLPQSQEQSNVNRTDSPVNSIGSGGGVANSEPADDPPF